MSSCFGIRDVEAEQTFSQVTQNSGEDFRSTVQRCCRTGGLTMFDGELDDGSVAHYLFRYLEENPRTGVHALVVAVLSIKGERS